MGDFLVAVPALKALRRAYPYHQLWYAAPGWLGDVVALLGGWQLLATPSLDRSLRTAGMPIDVAVNLHGRGPQSHRLLDALHPEVRVGHHCADAPDAHWPGPSWSDDPLLAERVRWARLLQWHGITADADDLALPRPDPTAAAGAAVVHVGAGSASRRWPTDRFAVVAAWLRRQGFTVAITGNADERARALQVAGQAGIPARNVLAGQQTLGAFAATVAHATVVVCADTGAGHLATAFDRPGVTIFGPASIEQWGPPTSPRRVSLTKARLRRGDPAAVTPDPALLGVSSADVIAALAPVLSACREATPGERGSSR